MKMPTKVLLGVALSFMSIFACIGYASISSDLSIQGTVHAEAIDFDCMVIRDVTVWDGTDATQSNKLLLPTNINTTVTGNAGQKIVYRITAKNESESNTYVYAGTRYDTALGEAADKVTITASLDEAGSNVVPSAQGMNYYSGTPIAPGEEITLYVTYTLNEDISSGEMLINFDFKPVIYTITYIKSGELYAIDCVTDNNSQYLVREVNESGFVGWINASGGIVHSYPAGSENSYTLSAKWENKYIIQFVTIDGDVLYQETFTESSKALSSEGQRIVDQKLAELNANAGLDMSVSWETYDIEHASSDITVRPIYTYNGNLQYTPKDDNNDGIVDRYEVDAVSALDATVFIKGEFNGKPVTQINKLYKNEGNTDYSSKVNTIIIEEGVQRLEDNSLSHTAKLSNVSLPSTITYLGKNVFSRNNWFFGGSNNDLKVLTITYNGTMAEWKALVANSHNEWHNGLKSDSKVICSDGYFELDRGVSGLGGYDWDEHPN
jgi:hypothetical protein